jgi:thioredoxin reductase
MTMAERSRRSVLRGMGGGVAMLVTMPLLQCGAPAPNHPKSGKQNNMSYDVIIVGGGPAGLSAALTLGRARKRVLVCDAGSPRNAAAAQVQGFVTRDGIGPAQFRSIARAQLEPYTGVEVRDQWVEAISGERGAFQVRLPNVTVEARRVLLCTGMIDELPELEGFAALWGRAIFQCPYCHGWEAQDRRFGVLAPSVEMLEFALLLRGWTNEVVALSEGAYAVPAELSARLASAGVRVDERRIAQLRGRGDQLDQVEFVEGEPLACEVMFARPAQRQVALVEALGLALGPGGYVQVDEMRRESSVPGIYAAGDLTTPGQTAIVAAAAGMHAASMLNHELTEERVRSG